MAREFKRTDRLGSQLQRELAQLVRDELKDRRLGMITIQEVRVTRDLAHAKVYFTLLSSEFDHREATAHLNEAGPYLRHLLGASLRSLRSIPQLHFVYDESVERGMHLDALIDRAVGSGGDEPRD